MVQPWGQRHSQTDYAGDVALLSELLSLLLSVAEMFAGEAALVGLTINWKKMKIQSLSDFMPLVLDLTVSGEQVEAVTMFTCLGALISTSCRSNREISRRLGMARATMRDLDLIWGVPMWHFKQRCNSTTSALDPLLYMPQRLGLLPSLTVTGFVFDQRCLRLICGIRWSRGDSAPHLSTTIEQNSLKAPPDFIWSRGSYGAPL